MKITVDRETLLQPLQAVSGVVERRQTMPILSHVLIQAHDTGITLTASDLEVELRSDCNVAVEQTGETTVSARKLLDICRTLPDNSEVKLSLTEDKLTVSSGRSRFSLAVLPANDFPVVDDIGAEEQINLPQNKLKRLLERTHFSMAQQDVRYYLNGLLLELRGNEVRAVGTDGHRLAYAKENIETTTSQLKQVIVPRKGVNELQRLLEDSDAAVDCHLGANHIRIKVGDTQFTSKLIEGRFPDYSKVIPIETNVSLIGDRNEIRQAIARASILSNEKYRGLRLVLEPNLLKIQAHNPDQEEASEEVMVNYDGANIEVGFNATYLMDALGALHGEQFDLQIKDANSSALIRGTQTTAVAEKADDNTEENKEEGKKQSPSDQGQDARYVVMPMRL